jgi:hypothetical protein
MIVELRGERGISSEHVGDNNILPGTTPTVNVDPRGERGISSEPTGDNSILQSFREFELGTPLKKPPQKPLASCLR